jgi:hypothetical protein
MRLETLAILSSIEPAAESNSKANGLMRWTSPKPEPYRLRWSFVPFRDIENGLFPCGLSLLNGRDSAVS